MAMRRRGTTANRTRSGKPSAAARRKYGTKSGPNRKSSFPIFDRKSAMSAIRLRGKAKSPGSVLNRAAAYGRRHHDKAVTAMVKRSRARMARKR